MTKVKTILFAALVSGAIGLGGTGSAQALTMGPGIIAGAELSQSAVQQVQFRGRGRGFRGRGFRGRGGFRGRRGFGAGAAIGLGILGLAAGAAAANAGGYHRSCWYERRNMYNRWGDYVGRRRVRVCN